MNRDLCRIAVAEDEPVTGWMITRQLDSLSSVSATYLDSRQELVHFMDSSSVDLIITNLRLSDGWVDDTLLRLLDTRKISVLVVTGLGHYRPEQDKNRKHIAILLKPFTAIQLKRCIDRLCPRGS